MVLIFGKGKTGTAVKEFLDRKVIDNIIVDDSDSYKITKDIEYIVVSPGVPFFHKIYKIAKEYRIPIMSELELADRYYRGKKIAITATDGKTTTSSLIYHILKDENVFLAGNIGIPFIDVVDKSDDRTTTVLELSSFQLYQSQNFKPDIAIILNISKDHLDWHKRFIHYVASKHKITKNQTEKEFLILNYDDEILRKCNSNANIYYFSLGKLPEKLKGVFLKDYSRGIKNRLVLTIRDKEEFDISIETELIGYHNAQNIMASVLACYLYGTDIQTISQRVETFKPLPHRIEFVKEVNGVVFFNDSKATTVQAVARALESFDGKVFLILGGINKGGDFSVLKDLLREKVKKVFLIGKSRDEIDSMIRDYCETEKVESLENAVMESYKNAEKSDIILLSPGCASFDMFKSYADRGNRFKEIVDKIDG